MERLLIILAVLVCVSAGIVVAAMAARGRRPPLRMDGELDVDDEDLLLGAIGAPDSPIDRSAQVLDARMLDLEPTQTRRIEAPRSGEAPRQAAEARPDRQEGAR